MNNLIEKNLDNQIRILKFQIKNCNDESFDSLIYKYNVFNNIKNTINEEMIDTKNYKNILGNDNLILDKIYTRFLDVNINAKMPTFDEVMLETFLKKEIKKSYPVLESDSYKGIYYSVMEDCDENKGGYFIEFYKDLENDYGEIDFNNKLGDMVIHIYNEDEMRNPKKYIEEYIENLLNELELDNEEGLEE